VRDYERDQIDSRALLRTSREIDRQYARSRLRGGDILLSIRGTTGRVAVVPDELEGANITQDSARVRVRAQHRRFLYHMLRTAYVQRQVETHTIGQAVQGINIASVRKLEIPWLGDVERDAVVRVLDALDRAVAVMERLASSKRKLKHGLMHDLLTGRKRFPEFGRGPIPLVRLGAHTVELSERNRAGLGPERVMGVLKGAGLMPMRDHVRALDLSRYKVMPSGSFAYNPMRLNIGSIARNLRAESCLVSPDYVVFKTDAATLLPAYLDQLRHSRIWSGFVRPAGSGSVRVRIYFRDLAEMRIPLPSLDEQRRIAGTLAVLDHEVELLKKLCDQYEAQKRGLLQRLLSDDGALLEPGAGTPALAHA
jgi:type I restriction enzyme, S subunit